MAGSSGISAFHSLTPLRSAVSDGLLTDHIQEAADRLVRGEDTDLPKLALDLGYFDQAHFIKDFKMMIGISPGEYSRTAV